MRLEELASIRKQEISNTTKLVLGAAGLLLFIVGVRKTFHAEGGEAPRGPEGRGGERREGGR